MSRDPQTGGPGSGSPGTQPRSGDQDGTGTWLRLLIVSYHYPPSGSVGARRPDALARWAADRGWDVRVLAPPVPNPEGPAPGIAESRVTRASPVPRMTRMVASVRRARRDPRHNRRRRALVRIAAIGRRACIPDVHANWIVPAVARFLAARNGWRPDVIVASGPPFSAFVVAATVAAMTSAPWVADYRDLWTVDNGYVDFGGIRRSVDHWLERRLLRSAAASVTVSAPLAETMRRAFGVDTHVVMNGIDRRPVPTPEKPASRMGAGDGAATLTLAHTGYLYPGRRDPTPLLDAVALLGDDAARVKVVFVGEDNGVARAAVERSGVVDSVTVMGRVSAEASWNLQAEADALVLLTWNDARDAGTVTGKLFDYLLARRPILMLGYEQGVAADLIRSRGAGVVLNDTQAIAEQLRRWLSLKKETGHIPMLPPSVLQGLFREDQLDRFLQILREVAGRGRAAEGHQPGDAVRDRRRDGERPDRGEG
jgi:glycosyltransferase involved in cell wall biosynthesis